MFYGPVDSSCTAGRFHEQFDVERDHASVQVVPVVDHIAGAGTYGRIVGSVFQYVQLEGDSRNGYYPLYIDRDVASFAST